jgi:hypothetical protein
MYKKPREEDFKIWWEKCHLITCPYLDAASRNKLFAFYTSDSEISIIHTLNLVVTVVTYIWLSDVNWVNY